MKKLLITDVDNTLFDWVDTWYRSFSAMLGEVARIMKIPESSLFDSISKVHQKYGTSEYAFLLEEIPEVRERYGDNTLQVMQPAIEAFREARRSALVLYPSVMETLKSLKSSGVKLVAYTESQEFYTHYRFRKLELDSIFDFLYSPPDHPLPVANPNLIRKYPESNYRLKSTISRFTPVGEIKPNPDILQSIIHECGVAKQNAVYVGDSLMKDIAMAQSAGVLDVWAKYGQAQDREQYELLRKVTHWTPEMVAQERQINEGKKVQPTHVLESGFSEICALID